MTVYPRKRALKEKGKFALYLDLYGQWQENLKLYLEPDKGNPTIKQMNKQTMRLLKESELIDYIRFKTKILELGKQQSRILFQFIFS